MAIRTMLNFCLLVILWPVTSFAVQPERQGQETSLSRAVWAEDRLWLLSDAGQLFSLGEGDQDSRREPVSEPVQDMCVIDGRLNVLTAPRKKPRSWSLQSRSSAGWKIEASINIEGDTALALNCSTASVLILSERRLITVSSGKISLVKLDSALEMGVATTLMTSDTVYVGFNKGEWGGGLRAIDRKSGRIRLIEKQGPNLCDGPLNSDCDPVNGLAVMPWRPDCIAAAIGLKHMLSHGRIVSICGTEIKELYRKPFGDLYPNPDLSPEDAYPTIAFFGLTTADGKLLALGGVGIYALGAEGAPAIWAMPKFQRVGDFQVSFGLSGAVLVLTSVNQRHAVSGKTPLIVLRQ